VTRSAFLSGLIVRIWRKSWGKYRRKNALATINNRERHKLKIGNNLSKN
jgi:hypothetical protein